MMDVTGRYHHGKGVPQSGCDCSEELHRDDLYYRTYILDYANTVASLHALTRMGVNLPASWTEEHERAVDTLKDLCSYPCLMNVESC